MLEGFLIFIAAAVILFLLFSIHVIPARKFALVEKLGKYDRILMPGLHFVFWPLETVRNFIWSYIGQDGRLHTLSSRIISFDACQMDMPIVQCISKDQIKVSVDVTVMYCISDLKAAAYETADVLNYFYQCTNQAIRNIVSDTLVEHLQGKDSELGVRIMEYVNKMMSTPAERGIRCPSLIVQQVAIDPRILEANQQIYALKRQQEMSLGQKRAEHELELLNLQLKKDKQQQEDALLLQHQRAVEEAAAMKWTMLKEKGFANQDMIELERITAFGKQNAKARVKTVYAMPPEFFYSTRKL